MLINYCLSVMSETVQFHNCRLLRGGQLVSQQLWIRDGKIIDPEPVFYGEKRKPDQVVDCHNALIVPGFIDLQINGKRIHKISKKYPAD